MTTEMIASQLELHRLNTGRVVPVCTANTLIKQMLFRYQGHIGAALILGGFDLDGPQLYCIYPHGSTEKLKYTTMGSGSLAAMAVFESRWKPDLAVRGIFNQSSILDLEPSFALDPEIAILRLLIQRKLNI